MPLQPSSAPRDLRNVSSRQIVLQKSPWRSCKIKIRNYRIGANGFLNQRCALTPDLESILRTQTDKIVLQHNLPGADICSAARPSLFDHLVGGDKQFVWHGKAKHPRGLGVDD